MRRVRRRLDLQRMRRSSHVSSRCHARHAYRSAGFTPTRAGVDVTGQSHHIQPYGPPAHPPTDSPRPISCGLCYGTRHAPRTRLPARRLHHPRWQAQGAAVHRGCAAVLAADLNQRVDRGVLCNWVRSASRSPVITIASSSSSSHTGSAASVMPERRDHRMLVLIRKSRNRLHSAKMAA